MKRLVMHVLLISLELAALLMLLLYFIPQKMPVKRDAYSTTSQKLSFVLSAKQTSDLDWIDSCRVYYATLDETALSEKNVADDVCKNFSCNESHSFVLPKDVTRFRIDFYPKVKGGEIRNPPCIDNLCLGDHIITGSEISEIKEEQYEFSGYHCVLSFFMNGWGKELISVAFLIWLAGVVGMWVFLRRQQDCR